jgi:hypothetical protein
MPGCIRAILAGGILYMLYAFAVFCVVVSLISGISDVVYHSRRIAAQEQWEAEAAARGEEFRRVDYTPYLVTGLASFALFGVSAVMAVMLFRQRYGMSTHILVMSATLLAGFILLLPRPPLGTGTEGMRQVFAYLTLLGVFESALYRTYVSGFVGDAEGRDS